MCRLLNAKIQRSVNSHWASDSITPSNLKKRNSNLDGQHFEVVIIGAGMAGLASGIRLGLAGKQSIILERHNASGGLNSFYSIDGIQYDVGLHALTNYVAKGTKGTPLTKLLRQLRIPYEAFDLSPQKQSRIHFPSAQLFHSNDFSFFESQIAEQFPKEIDAFRKLATTLRELDAFNLGSSFTLDSREHSIIFPITHY